MRSGGKSETLMGWVRVRVLAVGCSTKIKPEGDLTPRICPRCHNGASCRTLETQIRIRNIH